MGRPILLITDTFPPQADIGGLRGAMFAKYLPKFGWEPYVLCRNWPEGDPHRNHSGGFIGLPDEEHIHRLYYGTEDEIKALKQRGFSGKVKALFAPEYAHPPGVCDYFLRHLSDIWPDIEFKAILSFATNLFPLAAGRALCRSRRLPWFADLGDILEQEPKRYKKLRDKFLVLRWKIRRNWLLRDATAVSVVSDSHRQIMKRAVSVPVTTIPNGYDAEMFEKISAFPCPDRFEIIYMGRVLDIALQNPEPLFDALDEMLSLQLINPDKFSVNFIGSDGPVLRDILGERICKSVVKIQPRIPYKDVPNCLAGASVFLLLTNPETKGILTTKVFEYLAARKPILCVPGDGGDLDALMDETMAGVVCKNEKEIRHQILSWYNAWVNNEKIAYSGKPQEIKKYSRSNTTGMLSNMLEENL